MFEQSSRVAAIEYTQDVFHHWVEDQRDMFTQSNFLILVIALIYFSLSGYSGNNRNWFIF